MDVYSNAQPTGDGAQGGDPPVDMDMTPEMYSAMMTAPVDAVGQMYGAQAEAARDAAHGNRDAAHDRARSVPNAHGR